ncbi:efflux RND transporter periplasmic adaptor subunit [Aestuariirhabdus sp. Z084]|uniref:efflux RND transporter periplasmic adaptor subunit n=1 Tax=Aestuariirhabdus haliotis TaxID=2918751 RepID=UPI00201B3D7C|nr:efflux RND transporter periplasmic adaptor subunit [Aestuariirhabdus haliotis]MCL6414742.1 efflux RND transporter periplasmic adaptor subunit [Aestuariirhabdus haliotis]MCL6418674.1 efflux RND transporter periplasmic adaptor subunit [Aestuariirhabdus haliotis]
MLLRLFVMVLALVLVFGGIFGFELFKQEKIAEYMASYKPAPVTVSATNAQQEHWVPFLASVGTLLSLQGVDLASEQQGIVSSIQFRSGQTVKKGALLLQLDDSVEQANLKSFNAQLNLAQLNFNRDKALITRNAISQTRFDQSKAELDQALAQVQQTRATIQQKSIKAPFSGRIGIRQVEVGQFLSSGDAIATLQAAERLYVDFNLPEQNVPLLREGLKVEFNVEAHPETTFVGQIQAIDSRIDTNTRNILVRAVVDNPEGLLTPGMFAAIRVLVGEAEPVITLPETAIAYSLYGDTVFLVETDADGGMTVQRKAIRTGRIQNDHVEIIEGVKVNDQVITSGQLKLNNGTSIVLAEPAKKDQ